MTHLGIASIGNFISFKEVKNVIIVQVFVKICIGKGFTKWNVQKNEIYSLIIHISSST
jgi:hypothetical protein